MKILFSHLFPAQFSEFKTNWSEAWRSTYFKRQAIFTTITLLLIVAFIPDFFNYIQATSGSSINDFILSELQARDMSWYIFTLIYVVILFSIINLIPNPVLFLKCIQAYCLLVMLRIICLYLVPLEPEQNIIPLEDPLVGRFFYQGSVITKDLFFSGHVSTMSLLCFAIPFRPLKYYFMGATFLVAIFILIQHVHYTVDVLVAPVFSFISFHLISKNKLS